MLRFLTAALIAVLVLPAQAAEPKAAVFDVSGMVCMLCAAKVKKTLQGIPGVVEAKADYSAKRAEAKYDPDKVSVEVLAKAITEVGFKATVRK